MALLSVNIKDTDGINKELIGTLVTYLVIFLINFVYDIISAGGIASISWLLAGDAALKAFFITLVIYASNKGIAWKQGQE